MCEAAYPGEDADMEYILVAGGVGAVIGFCLGVLAMVILSASRPDERPAQACAYPHASCLQTIEFANHP